MPDFPAVSARALIGRRVCPGSLVKYGSRPYCNKSICRSPVSGCRRTAGTDCVGATSGGDLGRANLRLGMATDESILRIEPATNPSRDLAWQIVFRMAFPVASFWWLLRRARHKGDSRRNERGAPLTSA